ncbi:hypothetical protein CUMW_106020 [Citrus unshiu]|nr:hypothetical protein CUMW_106020 [Citrus unshiu]
MGTENPGRSSFPARPSASPFASAPPTVTPFSSAGPVVGSEASSFRPAPPASPQTAAPFMSAAAGVGSDSSGFRPSTPQTRFNDPSVSSSPTTYVPPTSGPFQQFPTPQFPPMAQAPPVRGPPVGPPPVSHPIGQVSNPPVPLRAQPPPVPMGSPVQRANFAPSGVNVPQPLSDSSFSASRPNSPPDSSYPFARPTPQQPLPGYVTTQPNAVSQGPTMLSSFPSHPRSYVPPPPTSASSFPAHQGGYVPPGVQSQHSGPPVGVIQGLAEDFSSLSFGSIPGSIEPGIDLKSLPRPLDGDVEPNSLAETYPLNCHSRYLRLTTSAIPNSQSLVSRWHLPLGAVVCPLAEPPGGVNAGRKWRCNICALLNDVPGDYFAHLDATGRRIDIDQRPELTKGSVEFVAPTEYMVRPPMPPLYFFLIDVSISAIRSGMLESSLTQPQMMVISDLDDIFVPLPDDLLVNLSESRSVVDTLLDSLPSMFQDNMNVESAFGPALKAAFMVMSRLGGKLLIFQNSLPSLGVGCLKLRGDDLRVYGTDKEHSLRIPEDPFYKQMAADLTKFQIAVNVYAFSDKYTDIASLGTLAKYTGGQVYYYPSFQSTTHGERLRHELSRDLTRETAWEAVMRIRCGKGVRFTNYHGNFMLRSTDLLALPAVDCDKAFAMQLSLEETLLTTQTVYFQVALLYTASCGERRIRVHTLAAPVVSNLSDMYQQADTGAIVSVFSRLAIEKTLSHKLEDARNAVQLRLVKALKEYRNLYAVQHRLGFCHCYTMMALPVKKLLKLLYPCLIRVDEHLLKPSAQLDEYKNIMKRLPLVAESLDSRGLYIFDDGFRFVLWFGRMLSPDIAMNLLGSEFAAELSKVMLREQDNEMSRKLLGILKKLREQDPSYYQLCQLVRQGEQPREGFLLLANLVEDQIGGSNGYADWIMQIHRQVLQNP